jgi:hypothetical protein
MLAVRVCACTAMLLLGLGLGVQTFAWASAPNESRIDKDVASEDEK